MKKIKYKKIIVQNFLSIGNDAIEIEFKEPIKRTRKKKEPIQVNNQKVLEFKLFGLSIFKLVK
jgi:hypothetical protein